MSTLDNTISLVLGDPSDDGHGKTDTFVIKSNLDQKDIEAAYKKGSEKLGFNLINEVCEEYEDSLLPKDKIDILVKNGFTIDNLMSSSDYDREDAEEAFEDDESSGFNINSEYFANTYLFIVKLGNKDFQYEMLKGKLNPTIDIGGYGLFY